MPKSDTDQLVRAIKELDNGGNFWSAVVCTFDLMDIAEDEIAKGQKRHPKRKEEIWGVFGQACPPRGMSQYTSDIYRMHVREICDVVGNGGKFVQPTDAELLLALSEASQKTPITGPAQTLFQRLFVRVFGSAVFDADWAGVYQPCEALYGKAADELYGKMKSRKRT